MTLKINYLDKKNNKNKNTAIFIDSSTKILDFQGLLDEKIIQKIISFIKKNKNSKEDKLYSLNQDFDQKTVIIFLAKSNSELDFEKLGAIFYNFLKKNEINEIYLSKPKIKSFNSFSLLNSFLHGVELKSYEFNLYKTKKPPKIINIFVSKKNVSKKSNGLDSILSGVNFTRDLVSEPGNILHPDEYAKRLNSLKKDANFKKTESDLIASKKEIKALLLASKKLQSRINKLKNLLAVYQAKDIKDKVINLNLGKNLNSALARRVEELQKHWKKMGVKNGLGIRMGISTGFCTVGNFGSDLRLDYTVLGSPVNLAARLQSAAERNGILIDENTNNLINDVVQTEKNNTITPKGFVRPIDTFILKDFKSQSHKDQRKMLSHSGERIEINVIDSSDIRAAIEELKNIQEKFEKEYSGDEK